MFDAFCLGVVLAVGQGTPTEPTLSLPPELPRHVTVPNVAKDSTLTVPPMNIPTPVKAVAESQVKPAQVISTPSNVRTMPVSAEVPGKATVGDGTPTRIPASLPTMSVPATPAVGVPGRIPALPVMQQAPAKDMPAAPAATAPAAAPAAPCATCEPAKEEAPAEEPEKGHFMKLVEGTHLGNWMDENKISISGWAAGSYTTGSSRTKSNLPVTWNDRSNTFLFQQFWAEIAKNVDTESKEFDWGFKVALLAGSDYRFTVNRGLFSNQLINGRPDAGEINGFQQNIYGADLPLFYASFWCPDLFEGTEIQVGRVFTPFGYESVMAPVTPLMSRSYAFNWAPPFFHTGINAKMKFSDTLSGSAMIANGNDVFFDGSDEIRFVGTLTKTFNDGDDAVTIGTSLGRGRFNQARPNRSTTTGLAWEPAGRNNINVFDIVWTHKVTDELSIANEGIFGYQDNVPTGATGLPGLGTNFNGTSGRAKWFSVVNYITYKWCDEVSSVFRLENFYDAHGQRTGFEGLYTAATFGFQISLTDSIMIRPEVRYDVNNYSNPFSNAFYSGGGTQNHLWTLGSDLIIKW